jgi:hypothetical protein
MEVFDIGGKLITTKLQSFTEADPEITLPVDGPSGTYILRVHTPTEVIRKKMHKL